jgi:hypothetical protein
MKFLKFLPLLAFALAPLDQANAMLIIPGESYGHSDAEVSAPNDLSVYSDRDRDVFPVGDTKKFDHETNATFSNQDGTAIANATWTFKSNPNKTVYSGTYKLDATGTRQTVAGSGTSLGFTLLEPANYSITASFDASFDPFLDLDLNEFSFASMVIVLDRLVPFEFGLEFTNDRNLLGGTIRFARGPLTGTLEPGDYRFSFSSQLIVSATDDGRTTPTSGSFGSGTGQFELSLDRLHGSNHVPDAGSTMTMLGMALCAIGGISRRLKA